MSRAGWRLVGWLAVIVGTLLVWQLISDGGEADVLGITVPTWILALVAYVLGGLAVAGAIRGGKEEASG